MKGSAHRQPLINAHSLLLVSSAGLHSRSCHPWGWRAAFLGSPRALRVQLVLLVWPHELPRPLGISSRNCPTVQFISSQLFLTSPRKLISFTNILFVSSSAALSLERWLGQVGSFATKLCLLFGILIKWYGTPVGLAITAEDLKRAGGRMPEHLFPPP